MRTSADESRLINADGYTRWWNYYEFAPRESVFGYTHGALASSGFPSATVNPYKYFADDLSALDGVEGLNISMRGSFSASKVENTRNYIFQFPMSGGQPQIEFYYAIDASWSEPDPSYAPEYPLDAFGDDANILAPYHL